MERIIENARAKVNLYLDVLNKREDGYHNIGTLFQTLALSEQVILEKSASPGIFLESDLPEILQPQDNLLYKAADFLLEPGEGVRIFCEKSLPTGAGLGGGSADAAAVLRGISKLFNRPLTQDLIAKSGKCLGADVPFMVCGGTAIAEGIGEKIEQIELQVPKEKVLIVTPHCFVSTPDAYAGLKPRGETQYLAHKNKWKQSGAFLMDDFFNHFESSVCVKYDEIQRMKEKLLGLGATTVLLSGSGASVFSLWKEDVDESAIKKQVEAEARFLAWTKFDSFFEKV